jgi:hypothetical protein
VAKQFVIDDGILLCSYVERLQLVVVGVCGYVNYIITIYIGMVG